MEDYMDQSSGGETDGSDSAVKPKEETNLLADLDGDEKFVWPWVGILVNLPAELKDGKYVSKSFSDTKNQLIARGFNPIKVIALWDFSGFSRSAVVKFNQGWKGYVNAMLFEKAYEADHKGKEHWVIDSHNNDTKSDFYGWVAKADDYSKKGIIARKLKKIGDLRTLREISDEQVRQVNSLVSNLTSVNKGKKRRLEEMESKYVEAENSLNKLIDKKDLLHDSYNKEIKKIQLSSQKHFQSIVNNHKKFKLQLEIQKKELESRRHELEKRELVNECERKKVDEETKEFAVKNSLLEMASDEQRKADESVMKLAEDQKREKEKLHQKIINLQKQLDAKQAIELDIENLRGQLNVMKHMSDDDNLEVLKKVDDIHKNLRDKEEELEDLESLNQTLVVQERKSNDELEDARKELIEGWKDLPQGRHVGLKTMGELENKAVTTALSEINDYNISGTYTTSELWNFTEGRKVSLQEGVSDLLEMWKDEIHRGIV